MRVTPHKIVEPESSALPGHGSVSNADLQQDINRIFRSTLSPLSLGLSALYAMLAVAFALRESQEVGAPLAIAALITSLTCLTIRIIIGRKALPLEWAVPTGAFMLGLVAFNCLLLVLLLKEPHQSVFLLLTVMCGGFVLLSRLWLTLFLLFCSAGWCAVVIWINDYSGLWTDYGITLFYAMVLSVLAHIVRRRSMEKLERYRVQHEMKNAELALALVSEEEAREFAENSRHKLEAAIRTANRSQQRFRRLTEATFEGLVIHDGGKIIDTNAAFVRQSGYNENEIIGVSLLALFAPQSRERTMRNIQTPPEQPFEAEFLRKDGSSFPAEIYSRQLSEKGHSLQVTAVRDITLRKAAEQAIRDSEALYRQMFEKNEAIKLLVDPASAVIVEANSAACKFYGYSQQQLKGMKVAEINTASPALILKEMERAAAEEKRFFTFKHKLASGEIRDVEVYTGPVTVRGRMLLYSIINDITERKKVERKLRQIVEATSSYTGKDFFNSLVRSLANALEVQHAFIMELADVQNKKLRTIAHWNGQTFGQKGVFEIRDSAAEQILKREAIYLPENARQIYPNDPWLTREKIEAFYAISLFDANGNVLGALGIMHNKPLQRTWPAESVLKIFAARAVNEIERTLAEQALRDSEERYRRFFEEDLTGDFISTPDGRLLACNPAFAKIFGFDSVQDAMKVDVFSLYPNHRERNKLMRRLLREKKLESIEVEFVHTSGRPIYAIENVIGKFDVNGDLVEMRGYIFDITERKILEDQLLHSQKMEAVGRLAGGVAHDFNNLLTAITGYSGLILSNLDDKNLIQNEVEEVKKACELGAALTSQLLTFSRRQVQQPRLLDLYQVVTDLKTLVKRLVGENIALDMKLEENLGYIRADLGQIKQVLMNLAVNALDAMPFGGKMTIELYRKAFDGSEQFENEPIRAGEYIALEVRDTGHGMDEETQSHIFEPFFTTKAHGKGTGLGLSTVYGVVKQSGGYVDVHSDAGEGTVITTFFPLVDEQEATQELELTRFKLRRGKETILLVEDEHGVRRVTRMVLAKNGYNVLEAQDADEALVRYNQHNGAIDLLISDMVMPGMNGQQLAQRLKSIVPGLKVLFISGYVDNDQLFKNEDEISEPFLQKPYSPDTLLMKVQEVLGD